MSIDLPGFADPVLGAQAAFRAVLTAMATPGAIHAAGAGLTPPAPLAPATAALLLTLADAETPVHLAPEIVAAAEWLVFHCGCPLAPAAEAMFTVTTTLPDLARLPTGTDEEPQASATILLQLESLTGGRPLTIHGPGLQAPTTIAPPLPPGFAAAWAANHALYPRGIDLILCAGNNLLALPRSLAIQET